MLKFQRSVRFAVVVAVAGAWGCGRVTGSEPDQTPPVPVMPSEVTSSESMRPNVMTSETLPPNIGQSEEWSWSACGSTARVLGVPAGTIVGLAIAANGAALVSGGDENRAWSLESEQAQPVLMWLAGSSLTTVPDLSSDGSLVTIAGDGGELIDMRTGFTLQSAPPLAGIMVRRNEVLSQMRFSPDGRLVAGAEYGLGAALRSVPDLQQVVLLKTRDRLPAAVFSPDSQWVYTSSPEKFRTDGTLAWMSDNMIDPEVWPSRWVELSEKGDILIVSGCSERDAAPCLNHLYSAEDGRFLQELPLAGHRPRISKEGDWVMADGELFHLKTRMVRRFDKLATASVFTPSGDIFTGHADGTLSRYCRSPR